MLKRFLPQARTALGAPRTSSARKEPKWDTLETRQMLSTASTDYVLSGFTWSNPSKITYSIPADGISWDSGTNNLNATLNAEYGGTSWQYLFAKALQTWAASANINVVPVADNSAPFNARGLAQGDPNFGDIRIGGYNFNDNTLLAQTYYPPPNGVTGAGDVEINTGFTWGPTAPYDLFSVLLHETGHSFGLAEAPPGSTSVMEETYGGVRTGLTPGDIAGIQAMYGPRVADSYQAQGGATSFANAYNLTSQIASTGAGTAQVTLSNTSLVTIGDTEYFTFIAPAGSNESMVAAASSMQVSSLSPKISVYDASMHLISPWATNGFSGQWSDYVPVEVGLLNPGQRYYVAVTGATNDVFSVGAYDLQLTFKGVTSTSKPAPPVPVPNPNPNPNPNPTPTQPTGTTPTSPTQPTLPNQPIYRPYDLGTITAVNIKGQSLKTLWNVDVYSFIAQRTGIVVVSTGTTSIQIVNQAQQVTNTGIGTVEFTAVAGQRYWAFVDTPNGLPTPSYNLSIAIMTASNQKIAAPSANANALTSALAVTPAATNALGTGGGTSVRVTSKTTTRPYQRIEPVNPRWARVGG
jgi:hypothetical protein